MNSFTNKDVAALLEEIGILLRLDGANDFKAIAFDRAARTLESLDSPIASLVESNEVTQIKGIGKSIAEDIHALFEDRRNSRPRQSSQQSARGAGPLAGHIRYGT